MKYFESELVVYKHILENHLRILLKIEDAQTSGNWNQVSKLSDLCRAELRLAMVVNANIKNQLGCSSEASANGEVLTQLRSLLEEINVIFSSKAADFIWRPHKME